MQPSVNMNSLRFHAQPYLTLFCFLAKFLSHLSVFRVAWQAPAETQKALHCCSRCPQNEEKVTGEEKRVEFMVLWRFGRSSGSCCCFMWGAWSVKWDWGMLDMTGAEVDIWVMLPLFTLRQWELGGDGDLRGRRIFADFQLCVFVCTCVYGSCN